MIPPSLILEYLVSVTFYLFHCFWIQDQKQNPQPPGYGLLGYFTRYLWWTMLIVFLGLKNLKTQLSARWAFRSWLSFLFLELFALSFLITDSLIVLICIQKSTKSEEGWRVLWPKHCGYSNQNEYSSLQCAENVFCNFFFLLFFHWNSNNFDM